MLEGELLVVSLLMSTIFFSPLSSLSLAFNIEVIFVLSRQWVYQFFKSCVSCSLDPGIIGLRG